MKKRILIPVMSLGFLVFGAFYSSDQNTVSAQINTEKSFVSESEFWLSDGNPIRYSPYYNTVIGSADLSSSTQEKRSYIVFEFYNLLGDLSHVASANILHHSNSQKFSVPIKYLEEGSYSIKVKVINAKVDPKTIKFVHK
ncbi:hypothetical protein [Bacillus tropicus]|uniref:hypothetical protein n=1 Tax=Bacillus tropicus TaxID=2026188 RepID=UPI002DB92907|nr:hypothetical protein [Bacillus tropicus]MEC2921443.1 hypothetical protein [Bacillus tropicus]MEC2926528.1 hypothetical protein [Bacillus tropicus]MEC2956121.1 hypothetical protein [Bacillus tropicus]MEC3051578.1 hypothetical protein [Bacillus tropicus]MEC3078013.1 hypothetical protein [Bacillus tropicus]